MSGDHDALVAEYEHADPSWQGSLRQLGDELQERGEHARAEAVRQAIDALSIPPPDPNHDARPGWTLVRDQKLASERRPWSLYRPDGRCYGTLADDEAEPLRRQLSTPPPVDRPTVDVTQEVIGLREWLDDYEANVLPLHGNDRGRVEFARDLGAVLAAAQAKTAPTVDVTADQVAEAMQRAWNDYVTDSGCYPDDFTIEGTGLRASFGQSNFARLVAMWLIRRTEDGPR